MARKSDTEIGRWPVAVYDVDGKRVEPGAPATVPNGKAAEFDARFGRLPDEVSQGAADPSSPSADREPAR